jgi:hypothetical protein
MLVFQVIIIPRKNSVVQQTLLKKAAGGGEAAGGETGRRVAHTLPPFGIEKNVVIAVIYGIFEKSVLLVKKPPLTRNSNQEFANKCFLAEWEFLSYLHHRYCF